MNHSTARVVALHEVASRLLRACEAARDVLEGHVASDCDMCGGEGGWTNERSATADPRLTPVRHKADCPYVTVKDAIDHASGAITHGGVTTVHGENAERYGLDLLAVLKRTADALESILSTEPDMPNFRADCDEADAVLTDARTAIAKATVSN